MVTATPRPGEMGTCRHSRRYPRSSHLDGTLNGQHLAALVTASCNWPRGSTNYATANCYVLALMRRDFPRRIEQHRRMESDPVPGGP